MRTFPRLVLMLIVLSAVPRAVHAQTPPADPSQPPPLGSSALVEQGPASGVVAAEAPSRRSPLMWSLYAATVLVQALDAHSTFRALDAGAIETNPLIGPIAGNRAAFVGLKAGISVATVYAARSLSRRHKVAAVIALVGINTAYGALVVHNYRIAATGP